MTHVQISATDMEPGQPNYLRALRTYPRLLYRKLGEDASDLT